MWDLPGFLLKVEFDFETKLKRWIKGGRGSLVLNRTLLLCGLRVFPVSGCWFLL